MTIGTGAKLVIFLVVVHTLLYYTQVEGFLPYQENNNPHAEFMEQFPQENASDVIEVGEGESDIKEEDWTGWGKIVGFMSLVVGILTSPYSVTANATIPVMFKYLIGAILGFLELTVIASFIWKKDF